MPPEPPHPDRGDENLDSGRGVLTGHGDSFESFRDVMREVTRREFELRAAREETERA